MPLRKVAQSALAELFAVLAHRVRIAILLELSHGERDVTELSEVVAVSQPQISQALAKLRAAHLVAERREGRHVYYRVAVEGTVPWLFDGLRLLARESAHVATVNAAVESTLQQHAKLERAERKVKR